MWATVCCWKLVPGVLCKEFLELNKDDADDAEVVEFVANPADTAVIGADAFNADADADADGAVVAVVVAVDFGFVVLTYFDTISNV